MNITSVASKPDDFGPRILRTILPDGERCCGNVQPSEAEPHVISTPRAARILLQAHMPYKGEENYHGNRLRELRDILTGETVKTFYASYTVHPDDAEKGLALAATL